jgi:16S rRNA (uracil1498-N3)-methyltransferase
VLDDWQPGRRLIFCDEAAEGGAGPIEALGALSPGPLAVLVGPEGGFSEEERAELLARPFVTPISLGPRILRADTAAVAALALVQATLGDWR